MLYQINTITIGCNDPHRLSKWYTSNFDWVPTRETEEAVYFQLKGQTLVLLNEGRMASEFYMWRDGNAFKNISIALGCSSIEEVDQLFQLLRDKTALIIKEPAETPGGGYGGCVADPEGNLWEFCFFTWRNELIPDSQMAENV
jgi:predicted lactoylglutathione lyase